MPGLICQTLRFDFSRHTIDSFGDFYQIIIAKITCELNSHP